MTTGRCIAVAAGIAALLAACGGTSGGSGDPAAAADYRNASIDWMGCMVTQVQTGIVTTETAVARCSVPFSETLGAIRFGDSVQPMVDQLRLDIAHNADMHRIAEEVDAITAALGLPRPSASPSS